MMGTSSTVTGPSNVLTVASSSVTFVAGSNMSLFTTWITLALSPVSAVVLPTSKPGEGRIGSPRKVLPSVDSKRIRRFQDVMVTGTQLVVKFKMTKDSLVGGIAEGNPARALTISVSRCGDAGRCKSRVGG